MSQAGAWFLGGVQAEMNLNLFIAFSAFDRVQVKVKVLQNRDSFKPRWILNMSHSWRRITLLEKCFESGSNLIYRNLFRVTTVTIGSR